MPAAARKPKQSPAEAAAIELAHLRAEHAQVYAREKELKAILIKQAGERGENFQVMVDHIGKVKVSAPHEPKCTGRKFVLVQENFMAVDERDRKELVKRGMVKEEEIWTGRYYGSVSVDLF